MSFNRPNAPSRMPAGKKAALVFSQGNPDEKAFSRCVEIIPGFLGRLGLEITDTLIAAGIPSTADDKGMMQRAYEIGYNMFK